MSEGRKLFVAAMGREPVDDAELAEAIGRAGAFVDSLQRGDADAVRYVLDCARLFDQPIPRISVMPRVPLAYTHDNCPWLAGPSGANCEVGT